MKPTKEELIKALEDYEEAVIWFDYINDDYPLAKADAEFVKDSRRKRFLYLVDLLYSDNKTDELDYNSTWSCC